MAWLIGRTYTAGKRDYDAVQEIQRQYELMPLSALGKPTRAATAAATAGAPGPARPDTERRPSCRSRSWAPDRSSRASRA